MDGPGMVTRTYPASRTIKAQRARLLARDGPACWLCRLPMDLADPTSRAYATIDHVVPVALGGTDADGNSRLAHRSCNSRRGARDPDDVGPRSRAWL